MTYYDGADYQQAFGVLFFAFGFAMIGLSAYMSLRSPTPDPSNSKAFGCYDTADGPPILLDQNGMTILQTAPTRIKYHLERHKTGIALTADAPIAAELTGKRYVFSIKPPGEGIFLDFFKTIDGRTYGEFSEIGLRRFTMLARDGAELSYRKVLPSACHV